VVNTSLHSQQTIGTPASNSVNNTRTCSKISVSSGAAGRCGACEGLEILVAQLGMNGAGMDLPSRSRRQPFRNSRITWTQAAQLGNIFVVGMLVADGWLRFCSTSLSNSRQQFTASFAASPCPIAEALLQFGFFQSHQIADLLMPSACRLLPSLPTPGFRGRQAAQETSLLLGNNPKHPVGFACAEDTFAISRELPIPTEQLSRVFPSCARVGHVRPERRTVPSAAVPSCRDTPRRSKPSPLRRK